MPAVMPSIMTSVMRAIMKQCLRAGLQSCYLLKIIIVVANSKGGVGKSTVSVHLAAWLHEQGRKVTLADCDTQQSSILIGMDSRGRTAGEGRPARQFRRDCQ
ncbi:MAG: ParA family protein [Tepidisphaeraceae bacterium]